MDLDKKGYSPEQVAMGQLENGENVIILYVKEFQETLRKVNANGNLKYFYVWSYREDTDSYALMVYWDNGEEAVIVFPPKQHSVVDKMKEPQNVILTAIPIHILVQKAQTTGTGFVDIEDSVVINGVVKKAVTDASDESTH